MRALQSLGTQAKSQRPAGPERQPHPGSCPALSWKAALCRAAPPGFTLDSQRVICSCFPMASTSAIRHCMSTLIAKSNFELTQVVHACNKGCLRIVRRAPAEINQGHVHGPTGRELGGSSQHHLSNLDGKASAALLGCAASDEHRDRRAAVGLSVCKDAR